MRKSAPIYWLRPLLKSLGPGIITGAADDDPSGIATYSVAGAQFGTKLLWTALLTWPLMASVQIMCARIGMVTGRGLAGSLKLRFPGWMLGSFVLALLAANTLNIGADLAGMADAAEMLTGINARIYVIVFALLISVRATVQLRYHQIANVLKWLVLVLFAYPITAFVVGVNWEQVLYHALLPSLPQTRDEWSTLIAILGTTISPYLFFWQASEEVEEEKAAGHNSVESRKGATLEQLQLRRVDVNTGAFFSNLVMFFIILTTAATLNRRGITHIETTRQAAEALQPLAGKFAAGLFTVGYCRSRFPGHSHLGGVRSLCVRRCFSMAPGLGQKVEPRPLILCGHSSFNRCRRWLNFAGVNPVKALFWTAVINGLLAPFLLVAILIVASDRKLMQRQPKLAPELDPRGDYHSGNVHRGNRHVYFLTRSKLVSLLVRRLAPALHQIHLIQSAACASSPSEACFSGRSLDERNLIGSGSCRRL